MFSNNPSKTVTLHEKQFAYKLILNLEEIHVNLRLRYGYFSYQGKIDKECI